VRMFLFVVVIIVSYLCLIFLGTTLDKVSGYASSHTCCGARKGPRLITGGA
jgi:hypothetical protein